MATLLIVESPTKVKSIGQYLKGQGDFKVLATKGHIRDLPSKTGAVDVDKDFSLLYSDIEASKKNVQEIVNAAKKADRIILATDPDREGEVISWHVKEVLSEKNLLKGKKVERVVFFQITKKAVIEALASPRDLDENLINAQKTRRTLDYLVGFNLSPLLWKKVKPGLSAGRVQSPALVLITEREQEIKAHVAREYFDIFVINSKESVNFQSKLIEYKEEKISQFFFESKKDAEKIKEDILSKTNSIVSVLEVKHKTRKNNPPPPFTTSTLQQEASKRFRFSTSKTMRVAQQLYEGIKIDGEQKGLITYMRTDSVHLGQEAIEEINTFIENKFGKNLTISSPRVFKSKSKNAQEAHEAIRPVNPEIEPDKIKSYLDQDQQKLYFLIWARAIASQMQAAEYAILSVILGCDKYVKFRASGSQLKFSGYLALYKESQDDTQQTNAQKQDEKQVSQKIPNLTVGEKIKIADLSVNDHVTEPPPRYSEASLVKALEEYGIGRPSTYSAIISTITSRNYVELKERRFFPTDVGEVVSRFLKNYFTKYVDYSFTAKMEDDLDAISLGKAKYLPVLKGFWQDFNVLINETEENVKRSDVTSQELDENCPECNKKLQLKLGKRGNFVGCSGYPDCSYTKNVDEDAEQVEKKDELLDRKCPKCSESLIQKQGKFSKFIGCSGFPSCKYIENDPSNSSGTNCPSCKQNEIIKRFTKRGKIFYGCAGFPKCKYALWNEPVEQDCPDCGWPIMTKKITQKQGEQIICPECSKKSEK